MRLLHRPVTRFQRGLDVDQAQLAGGNAGFAQRNVFDDGEILAVATALADGFQRRCPLVALLPDRNIVLEMNVLVNKVVDLP